MILTDYPYRPRAMRIAESVGGKRLIERLQADETRYAAALRAIAKHVPALALISAEDEGGPFWHNDWFPPFDGAALYGLLATQKPRRYIEVGSGMSTRFARRVIRDLNLQTEIVSIDPHPRVDIDAISDILLRCPMEDVDPQFWRRMTGDDILFVDNSHRSFPGSDVTAFFVDVLPIIPSGMIWGLHDIFLPDDYPPDWMDRFYNEQYLLLTYLLGGAARDDILLPVYWASYQPRLHDILAELWGRKELFEDIRPERGVRTRGGAFWMRRKTKRWWKSS